jgi:hypothetical protein
MLVRMPDKGTLYAVGGNVSWCNLYGNQYGDPLKN